MKAIKALVLLMSVAMAMIGTSCSSSRQAVNNGQTPSGINGNIGEYAQYATWKTLVSKGKVTLTAGAGKTVSSSMQMKMIAGRSISISVRPLLGIEMARLYIANDEIIILDRYHKIYVREKASVLTSGVPVDITTLQDILLGRPHILGKGTFTAALAGDVVLTADNGTVKLTPVEQYEGFNYAYVFNADRNLERLDVSPAGGESIYSANYRNVETTLAGKVATEVDVATKLNGTDISLGLSLKTLTWNNDISDDIEIPADYQEATGSSIIKALGGTVR